VPRETFTALLEFPFDFGLPSIKVNATDIGEIDRAGVSERSMYLSMTEGKLRSHGNLYSFDGIEAGKTQATIEEILLPYRLECGNWFEKGIIFPI